MAESLTALTKSDTWVFSLCERTNLYVPLIKPNEPFFVQRIVFLPKASDEVIVQLLKQKCMPILLYGLDVCNLDKRSLHSLDFTVNRFLLCALSLAPQCIVIGPVCVWVCLCVCGSVTTITRNCVHRSSPNWVCR